MMSAVLNQTTPTDESNSTRSPSGMAATISSGTTTSPAPPTRHSSRSAATIDRRRCSSSRAASVTGAAAAQARGAPWARAVNIPSSAAASTAPTTSDATVSTTAAVSESLVTGALTPISEPHPLLVTGREQGRSGGMPDQAGDHQSGSCQIHARQQQRQDRRDRPELSRSFPMRGPGVPLSWIPT